MINVLSLFDGLGGTRIALDRLGIDCKYYASEIDKHSKAVCSANYPDIVDIGDIYTVKGADLPEIFLLAGGSPCQNLSSLGDRTGLDGVKSKLFWEYVRVLQETKPKYFILENVGGMLKKDEDIITATLGVSPILINSNCFTAQNRKRYYWTNLETTPIETPSDLVLKDILESNVEDRYYVNSHLEYTYSLLKEEECWRNLPDTDPEKIIIVNARAAAKARGTTMGGQSSFFKKYSLLKKAPTVTASGLKQKMTRLVFADPETGKHRFPTELECERLQGLPDNYTEVASSSQRYRMIGNGFSVPAIEYVLKDLKELSLEE